MTVFSPASSIARRKSWWFSTALIVGILSLGWLGLRSRSLSEPEKTYVLPAPIVRSPDESTLDFQERVWLHGRVNGQTWRLISSHQELTRAQIDQRADEIFPSDRTASLLWAMGFEEGQMSALRHR